MNDVRECRRCGGDVFGSGKYQLCDQCLDVVLIGADKKSDRELSALSLPKREIEENTRSLRHEFQDDVRYFTSIDRSFKELRSWLKTRNPRKSSRKPGAIAEPGPASLQSAFVSYSRVDGESRAWSIAEALRSLGCEAFTYTFPGSPVPDDMHREVLEKFLKEKVLTYDSIIVVLTGKSMGISYVTTELLAALDGTLPIFAMLPEDVTEDITAFDEIRFLPSLDQLSEFYRAL